MDIQIEGVEYKMGYIEMFETVEHTMLTKWGKS